MDTLNLDFVDSLPEKLKSINPEQIRSIFPNPTIINVPGESSDCLFLSTLLHGNETTSFFVLQKLADYLSQHKLKRSLAIFVGNVWACEQKVRFLPSQPDYNRIWANGDTPEHELAMRVIKWAREQKLFASIDIHNNTGVNPFYSCVRRMNHEDLYLAHLFSRIAVYFENPGSVQACAFAPLAPSVTIECGQAGNWEGVERAFQFVVDVLNAKSLDHKTNFTMEDVCIYHTLGRVIVPDGVEFEIGEGGADLILPSQLEKFNFCELKPGSVFAHLQVPEFKAGLRVVDEYNNDLTERFFSIQNSDIVLRESVVPSMLTINKKAITDDCLGYLMTPVNLAACHMTGGKPENSV